MPDWLAKAGSSDRLESAEDETGAKVDYGYDDFGSVTSITAPGGTATTFEYDEFER